MSLVRSEFVYITQDDLPIVRQFDWEEVTRAIGDRSLYSYGLYSYGLRSGGSDTRHRRQVAI